jgi:hypothetical protein
VRFHKPARRGRVFTIAACYQGDLSQGEKVLQPLRSFGKQVADLFAPISYVQMQSLFDPFFPPGRLNVCEVKLRAQLER